MVGKADLDTDENDITHYKYQGNWTPSIIFETISEFLFMTETFTRKRRI